MDDQFDVAVVGGGAAGTMATLRAVLNNRRTLHAVGDVDSRRRSRAQWVSEIDNMPGLFGIRFPISRHAQESLDWIKGQEALQSNLTTAASAVHTLEQVPGGFRLSWTERQRRTGTASEHCARARFVVLATGIMDVQPTIGGTIEAIYPFSNANQVLYCVRCDGHRVIGHRTAVLGHSTSAAWTAIQLFERYAPPAMAVLTNGEPFAGSEEVKELLEMYQIPLRTGPIGRILGTARRGGLEGFEVDGETLAFQRAFVSLGVIVYNKLAVDLGAEVDVRGYIKTTTAGESSVSGLYAVGDLQAGRKKQVYTGWDSAVDAVDDIDLKIRTLSRQALRKSRAG